MPRNDIIAFVDLETTGTEEDLDNIIEVGISVWSWPAWKEVFAKSYLVMPTAEAAERMMGKDVVREMHTVNGLLAAIRGETEFTPLPVGQVDAIIDDDLSIFGTRGSRHIPLGGSGVCHFDRRFMRRYLPLFDARLSYWSYDVGGVRRMFLLAGAKPANDSGKTHRALDDARVHADEFKWYMEAFTRVLGELRADSAA